MTSLNAWVTQDSIRTIGWVLVHFVWQGAALASTLYVALAFLRTARSRYAAGLGTLVLMVICPCATFFLLTPETTSSVGAALVHGTEAAMQAAIAGHGETSLAKPFDWLSMLVIGWLAGVLLLAARAVGGCLLVERLRRQSTGLAKDLLYKCVALQERLGLKRKVAYVESEFVDAPSALGWLRPVVLLPVAAIAGLSPQQLDAVIIHELEHIRRLDYLANMLQVAVETLLFYHPAVWWVNRMIRTEREHCCDDAAVALCGDAVEYAKALTAMEQWRATPALVLAANGGCLRTRVSRLLGMESLRLGVPRAGMTAAGLVCAVTVLFAGTRISGTSAHASFVFDRGEEQMQMASAVMPAPVESEATARPSSPVATAKPLPEPQPREAAQAEPSPAAAPVVAQESTAAPAAPVLAQSAEAPETPEADGEKAAGGSYIGSLESLGYKNMSADQLIALKVQGVTPQYIRGMRASGLKPTVSELVGLKVQGVTPAYVREMRATGLQPSISELMALKVQGVTADYVKRMKAASTNLSVGQIIALRVQNVNPADAANYKQLGLQDVSLNTLLALHVQGVTPDYIRAMKGAGFGSVKADDYVAAKVQGVTPEFVRKARSQGLTNLTPGKIIELKVTGVF